MKLRYRSALVIILLVFISGCSQEQNQPETSKCPSSCDDKNPCTKDFCSEQTNFKCAYDEITPCCGNSKCEQGENSLNCNDCLTAKTTTMSPSELSLKITDLPPGYTLLEERPVLKSEMVDDTDVPQELLKWESGYLASFSKRENLDIFAIGQRIYVFPSTENLKELDFSSSYFLMDETSSNTYEKIPCDIGDSCMSWKITTPIDNEGNKATTYALQFVKLNVYEDLFVFHLDRELLVDLAGKAEAKIKS
ncbi:MAG: hypothetical protein KAJ24_00415 [Candidatus Aenigmarchaeota archaeon]|nr:hypothetical protein [Candidatus Aenigmarchaeota archaeon]